MSKPARQYVSEASQALDSGCSSFAIWMIENAISVAPEGEDKHIADTSRRLVLDTHFDDAKRQSEEYLRQAHQILSFPNSIDTDEWVLIISYVSSAYAVYLFSQRTRRDFDESLLQKVWSTVRSVTNEFRDRRFLSALRSARRHNPNPLPKPF